jgi:hypothetical protein
MILYSIISPPSVASTPILITAQLFLDFIPMVCRNICERIYSKIQVGENIYFSGKKYCRRCEIYFYHNGVFCPCCGMQLRLTPSNKEGKERIRQRKKQRKTLYMMSILSERIFELHDKV